MYSAYYEPNALLGTEQMTANEADMPTAVMEGKELTSF